ncbi:MAG TPA: TMEM43 family protein [Thermoanaerobaculia bacterium]|nr:TMEM43 family protein [Thermoanaerobaculia bacterium]
MSDRYTVTTSKSWFARLAESIKSVLIGLILFVVSFPLLFWNESRAVTTARSLEEGAGAVVTVAADAVSPDHEGTLVHVTGPVATTGPVVDEDLGIEADAVKLLRKVEMYQWIEEEKSETQKKLGGGEETVTTYEYKKAWSSDPVDSSAFYEPAGHENPGDFPLPSTTFVADPVTLGAFTLSAEQVDQLDEATDLPVDAGAAESLPDGFSAQVDRGAFYMGANPATPAIGDVRISFQVVNPEQASVVAVQTGDTFAPYQAEAGDAILLVEEGVHTSAEMFQTAQSANTMLTWILRVGGFFAMFLGLFLVFRPLSVLGDVVPFIGSLLGIGVGLFAFVTSFALTFITIAIAWIAVRPILGITLLVLAGAGLFWLISANRKKKRARQQAQPSATQAA